MIGCVAFVECLLKMNQGLVVGVVEIVVASDILHLQSPVQDRVHWIHGSGTFDQFLNFGPCEPESLEIDVLPYQLKDQVDQRSVVWTRYSREN